MPPAPGWNKVLLEDQFDAVLFLGTRLSPIRSYGFPPALCDDAAYMKMRLARMTLNNMKRAIDELKAFCAAHGK
jgi:hypothetical protein